MFWAEELLEMGGPGSDAIERVALVRAVIIAKHLAQAVERGAFHFRTLYLSAANLAQLALEEADGVDTVGRG